MNRVTYHVIAKSQMELIQKCSAIIVKKLGIWREIAKMQANLDLNLMVEVLIDKQVRVQDLGDPGNQGTLEPEPITCLWDPEKRQKLPPKNTFFAAYPTHIKK